MYYISRKGRPSSWINKSAASKHVLALITPKLQYNTKCQFGLIYVLIIRLSAT
jgi:hypothetical protein